MMLEQCQICPDFAVVSSIIVVVAAVVVVVISRVCPFFLKK
jgi:hypothetical protein